MDSQLVVASTSPDDIFCASNCGMADGRVGIFGGSDAVVDILGDNRARIWKPGEPQNGSSWSNPALMTHWRWYPGATALATGEQIILSGATAKFHTYWGGKRAGALPTGSVADSVGLYAAVANEANNQYGRWSQSVIPIADENVSPKRPSARWRHSAVGLEEDDFKNLDTLRAQIYFGGRAANGGAFNDTWLLKRDRNYSGAGYQYRWLNAQPAGTAPDARSDHSAVVIDEGGQLGAMIVFGGLKNDGTTTLNDVHRLSRHSASQYRWDQMFPTGTPPSARYGHTAFYDNTVVSGTARRRMIVYGGAASPSSSPNDYGLYELRFSDTPGSAVWDSINVRNLGDGRPEPRLSHAMVPDEAVYRPLAMRPNYTAMPPDSMAHVAYMFGGKTASSESDELWVLWLFQDGTAGWTKKSFSGAPPARTLTSLTFSTTQGWFSSAVSNYGGRLYLFGGEAGGTAVDKDQYVLDPWVASPTWTKWAASDFKFSGLTGTFEGPFTQVRPAEVFDPANGWRLLSSANLLQNTYPPTFLISGGSTPAGRVVTIGADLNTYYLDVPTNSTSSGWTKLENANLGFESEPMVMYRPGKIMAASLIEVGEYYESRTKTLDLSGGSSSLSNSWQTGAPATGTGSLAPRYYHNMALMPDGKVIAIGGLETESQNDLDAAVTHPQIWDPGTSTWTSPTLLDNQPHPRNYHSTAILLPDGRILSAGGDGGSHRSTADVYCPPYLFNGDALATRPNLISTTGRWRYNWPVTFSVGSQASIQSACLIRAPATTHAYDQSQRYVPLTLSSYSDRADGVRQYSLTAPADSFIAPPGDYMLFVLNSSGVPGIAQWVRVGSAESGQFDAGAPSQVDLACEYVTCSGFDVSWVAPGDDGNSGTALDYDLRYSSSSMDSSSFMSSNQVPDTPVPLLHGTTHQSVSFLSVGECQQASIGLRTRDKAGNWSPLSTRFYGSMCGEQACGGGGGGMGESVTRGRDEGGGRRSGVANSPRGFKHLAITAPTSLEASASTIRLVGGFDGGDPLHWQLAYRDFGSDAELLAQTATQALVQELAGEGTWLTRRTLAFSSGLVGMRPLIKNGRVIFPAGAALQAVELEPRSFDCDSVSHSRLGNLTDSTAATPELSSGDTLSLTFTPNPASGEGENCLFVVRIPEQAQTRARPIQRREPTTTEALPTEFVFHPAHPNPFSRATTLRFDLPRTSPIKFEVFDVQGRRITTLASGTSEAGRHTLSWDGRTDRGGRAEAGVYLCRMTAGSFVAERRVSLLP